MKLIFAWDKKPTTEIYADLKNKSVQIKNLSDDVMLTAFGANEHPSFSDFEALLEDRCLPQSRDKLKLCLKELGLDYYSPLDIIRVTKGEMAGDFFTLEIVEEP